MPTVAALRPESSAYTGVGRVLPTYAMPTDRPYIPTAPGRLLQSQQSPCAGGSLHASPKQEEGESASREATVDRIDAEKHLGTRRSWQCLTDCKYLLILDKA
jgi:hypothetical protein